MNVVNDFLGDMYEKIVCEASQLHCKVGRRTLLARDIEGVVSLILHGELRIFSMMKGLQVMTLLSDSYGLDTHADSQLAMCRAVKHTKF